ncbi:MAG: TlpA family protein disulfide reductase [Lachnospiraceae bacterium]|nr:TlpA family protein disulfide reductase [Lachnospiraceae bacterium]
MAGCVLLYKKLSAGYGTDSNLEIKGQVQESQKEDSSEAPDFTVENSEGEMISLSSLEGKPVVLNFWASWCPPCKSEMPDFQKAYETYGEDIQFVMVNLTDGSRETKETAKEYIDEQGYTFPVYYDVNMEAAYAYYVSAVPATYFINAEGKIVAAGRGMLDGESLEEGISILNTQ